MDVRRPPTGIRRRNRRRGVVVTLARRTSLVMRGAAAAGLLVTLIAGIPWGLGHYIGWPLPDHMPATREIASALTAPLSAALLLDTLACALWATWAVILFDVLRTAAEAVRTATWPLHKPTAPGPLSTIAAALVGAVVLAILPNRDPQVSAAAQKRPLVVSAPVDVTQPSGTWSGKSRLAADGPTDTTTTAVVHSPRDGVHDSLWRIAERRLGDGSRWPEIYALNRDRVQADGRVLNHPNLIQPGWVLRLPTSPTAPPDDGHEPNNGSESPSSKPPSPGSPSPSQAPQPSSDSSNPTERPDTSREPGVHLPGGAFVGFGLAAAIAAALFLVRRRRRIRYRPGSGERSDVHIAPVVRALRRAHDEVSSGTEGSDGGEPAVSPVEEPEHVVGVKDGRTLAWDLARSRGLGLVGTGALDAARALLVSLLATRRDEERHNVEIVIPAPNVRDLLRADSSVPRGLRHLRVANDLTEALQMMEAELLSRSRTVGDGGKPNGVRRTEMVLLATPTQAEERRLQAILDNGSHLGMAGILIGQWSPGGTLWIRQDGTVAATNLSHSEPFTGARLFTLPADDARALIDLLAEGAAAEPVTQQAGSSAPPVREALPRPRRRLTPPSQREHPGEIDVQESDLGDAISPSDGEAAPAVSAQERAPAPGAHDPEQAASDKGLDHAIRLSVLGPVRLMYRSPESGAPVDITNSLARKQREVLAFLALHHEGARRETLAATIWPDAPRSRPYNSLHATLSQLRRALRSATHDALGDITLHDDARYALDPEQVGVDLWEFRAAVDVARDPTGDEGDRHAGLEKAASLYTGDFADDVVTEWTEAPREALRREYLDSVSTLVRAQSRTDPRRALHLLERARELDRYNEAIYRDIARMQARLGLLDAVSRTLELLRRALAELGEEPSNRTVALCLTLRSGRAESDLHGRAEG